MIPRARLLLYVGTVYVLMLYCSIYTFMHDCVILNCKDNICFGLIVFENVGVTNNWPLVGF